MIVDYLMKCECCNKEHKCEYGSGRFCGVKCARSFSTKEKRLEINKKTSAAQKGKSKNPESIKKSVATRQKNNGYGWGVNKIPTESYLTNEIAVTNKKLKNRLYSEGYKKKFVSLVVLEQNIMKKV